MCAHAKLNPKLDTWATAGNEGRATDHKRCYNNTVDMHIATVAFFLLETQHTNTQQTAQAALHQPLAHPHARSMLQAVTIGNDELVES